MTYRYNNVGVFRAAHRQHGLLGGLMLFFIAVMLLSPLPAKSQHGQLAAMRGVVDGGYNFWLYAPREYLYEQQRVPVIIFLHGASLCGKNMERVRRYGLLHAIEKGRYYPCMVIAPQNHGGAWSPQRVGRVLDWVIAHHDVDTTRVYVIGMSLGGYGTLDFAGTYPHRVAAAMALCGGCTLRDMSGLAQLPLWIMHGTADKAVPVKQSKAVVKAIEALPEHGLLRYDWLRGASHGALARILYLKQTYDWLFYHTTKDHPRELDRDVQITLDDLKNAYSDLDPDETRFDIVSEIRRNTPTP